MVGKLQILMPEALMLRYINADRDLDDESTRDAKWMPKIADTLSQRLCGVPTSGKTRSFYQMVRPWTYCMVSADE